MVNPQRKSWQLVPPIVTGGEVPLSEDESEDQPRSWQLVPPIVTGVHPAIPRGATSASLPAVQRQIDTEGRSYALNPFPMPLRESQPVRIPAPFQIPVTSKGERVVSISATPTHVLDWDYQPQGARREHPGAPVRPRNLLSLAGSSLAGVSGDDLEEYTERRRFFNQVVQPALEGLMDGSLSSLGPIFLTIFMTRQTLTTFFIGAGAALAGGISETFSEGLSDDEDLSERGNPFVHAGITGLFTFISGLIPALPFLIANYRVSLSLAYAVVLLELTAIAIIRCKFLGVKWWLSAIQIVGGGALVFIAAVLLGNA
jgi:hypothetical protein